jgi:homoserine kinase type II
LAVYTNIDEDDLAELLADFDLGAALSCKGIAEGIENSNYLLETPSGRFILTLYERRVRAEDLPYFLGLMQWLAGKGFPCPTPMADRQGRMLKTVHGRPAALVTFLTGVSVQHPSVEHCRQAGEGLARLHLAGEGFPLRRENTLGQHVWAGLFDDKARATAESLRPGLADRIGKDIEDLDRVWPGDLPTGPIHADLFPDNVFFLGERFSAAIDFYFACDDALAYDLAVCLNSWAFEADGTFSETRAQALLDGYETLRQLTPAEHASLRILSWGAAMRFFLTRLIDWTATPPGALVRPKDPMEYATKLAFFRTLPTGSSLV